MTSKSLAERKLRAWFIVEALAFTPACDGCSKHKPYTPFNLDASATTSPSTIPSVTAPAASGSFSRVDAMPGNGAHFDLNGSSVDAPTGRTFLQGLALDADSDGTVDLVSWLSGPDNRTTELAFTTGADLTKTAVIAKLPTELLQSGCKRSTSLAQIGASTILGTVSASCGEQRSTWFTIVRLGAGAPPVLRLDGTAKPLGSGESLDLSFSADDRDKDGNDDLTLTVTLDGLGAPFDSPGKASIPVAFVERASGLARDATEPAATLMKLGGNVIAKGRVAKLADASLGDAARLFRLATAVCDELGETVVTTSAGPVRCGDTGFIGDAVYGVGTAAITRKDLGLAASILDLSGKLKLGRSHTKELAKLLDKAAPVVTPKMTHTITSPASNEGVLSPFAFVMHDVLVAGPTSSALVHGDTLIEEPTPAPPWPLSFAWFEAGLNFNLTAADRSCAPATRGWVLHEIVGGSSSDVRLPTIEAALPPKAIACTEAPLPLSALVSIPSGAYVAVGSVLFKVETQGSGIGVKGSLPPDATAPPSSPGQSRATDGSAIALPIDGGVLVVGATESRRVLSPDLKGATKCAVENGGAHIACLVAPGGKSPGSGILTDAR